MNAEADGRTQPTSIKPDIKEICKSGKTMPLFSLDHFALENIAGWVVLFCFVLFVLDDILILFFYCGKDT